MAKTPAATAPTNVATPKAPAKTKAAAQAAPAPVAAEPKAPKEPKPVKVPAAVAVEAPAEEGVVAKGTWRAKDVPWHPKKVAVFKALKALNAVNPPTAVSAEAVVEKAGTEAGLVNRDVRHYCYHGQSSGLTGVAQNIEGIRGYGFFLTQKGQAVNPDQELKNQSAAKDQKAAQAKEKAAKEAEAPASPATPAPKAKGKTKAAATA